MIKKPSSKIDRYEFTEEEFFKLLGLEKTGANYLLSVHLNSYTKEVTISISESLD